MSDKIKRTWHFLQNPPYWEIKCPVCGEANHLQWSEYDQHIWCESCNDDISGYESPYSGPMPLYASKLLGIDLRIVDMVNNKVVEFHEHFKL